MRWVVLTIVLASCHVLPAETLRGKVVGISDGDTITVLDSKKVEHRVRLDGIDAPEKEQAFGAKSKAKLSELVGEKTVVVRWSEKDRYDRILGDVKVGEQDVNLTMVEEGLAWHYKQYSKSKTLAAAESGARKARRGLWATKKPTPPWDYRHHEDKK